MKDRLKKLRRELGITQSEFARRIGSVQNTITGYESGRRAPSGPVISLICKEFNVNEEWLLYGTGEMFKPKPSAPLDALAREYHLTNGDYILFEKLLSLRPEARKEMLDFMTEVAAAIGSDDISADAPAFSNAPIQSFVRTQLDADVEEYRRERQEELKGADALSDTCAQSTESDEGAV